MQQSFEVITIPSMGFPHSHNHSHTFVWYKHSRDRFVVDLNNIATFIAFSPRIKLIMSKAKNIVMKSHEALIKGFWTDLLMTSSILWNSWIGSHQK